MLTKAQNNVVSYSGAALLFLVALACFGRSPIAVAANISADAPHAAGSGLACVLWVLHFARRAVESALVEKHSQCSKTVPLADSLSEFAYYWLFAIWIAHSLVTSQLLLPSFVPPATAACGWALAELTNFYAHLTLSRTPAKGGKRVLPVTRLFSLVCCPHYLAEASSWVFFSLCCPCAGSLLFTLAGAAIMTGYALERHRQYAACDTAFARSGRKAIIPFIL